MAKRFTDSGKFAKPWFRTLPPEYKLLFLYILDNCDLCGVWQVDLELAAFCTGADFDDEKINGYLGKQLEDLGSGKWLVVDFVEYQYGQLSAICRPHRAVMDALRKHGLPVKGKDTLQDQDKDKDKDKNKEKNTAQKIIANEE